MASQPSRIKRGVLRWTVTIHRWTGVVACLFFLFWFLTGAVMAFVPFPELSRGQRLALGEPLNPAVVAMSPAQAFGAEAARLKQIKLVTVGGTPLYIGQTEAGPPLVRSASTGIAVPGVTPVQARAAAEHFGRARAQTIDGPLRYDQWIVNASYNFGRPFYRVRLAGPSRTDLYVAARTGEIMQRTTAYERGWAWAGSIVHWAYFTVLGQHRQLWNQVCWWGSLFAFAVAILGMVLGVWRWLEVRRAKRLSPFPDQWLRWHHITGLFGGILVLTWMGSGWLSNDNHRLFSSGAAEAAAQARYDGPRDPSGYALRPDVRFAGAAQVDYLNVGGKAYVVGRGGQLPAPVALEARTGRAAETVPERDIRRAIAAAWPATPAPSTVPPNDFYAKAEGLPPGALKFDIPGSAALKVYVDPQTGVIASVMDRSRRASAWLYYGLHTFQLPGLVGHDNLRRTLECLLLLIGASVSATGVVIGYTRLRQTAADLR